MRKAVFVAQKWARCWDEVKHCGERCRRQAENMTGVGCGFPHVSTPPTDALGSAHTVR